MEHRNLRRGFCSEECLLDCVFACACMEIDLMQHFYSFTHLCFIHSTLFYTLIVFLVFADAVLTPWDAISQDLIHPSTPNSNVTSMKAFFIDLRQKASLSPLLL